jgi:hypothetical protein
MWTGIAFVSSCTLFFGIGVVTTAIYMNELNDEDIARIKFKYETEIARLQRTQNGDAKVRPFQGLRDFFEDLNAAATKIQNENTDPAEDSTESSSESSEGV